jgi:hypothetical protein
MINARLISPERGTKKASPLVRQFGDATWMAAMVRHVAGESNVGF